MVLITNEDKFQEWVQLRLTGAGAHFQDHRESKGNGVPDLSCAWEGVDYWLELKYAKPFKLLHYRYDRFYYNTVTTQQLMWLRNRSRNGRAVCGILGYFSVIGNRDGEPTPYLSFHTAGDYYKRIWLNPDYCAGAAVLSPCTAAAHSIETGRDLLAFIAAACPGGSDNARPGAHSASPATTTPRPVARSVSGTPGALGPPTRERS